MIKHIVFDFDGTIVDSMDLAVHILNELADKFHYQKVTTEEVRVLKNFPVRERFKRIGLPLYKIPSMTVDSMTMFKQQIHTLNAFEGIKDLLISLKEYGYRLSVISSNSVDNITDFLKRNDLEVFDHVISENNLFGKDKCIKKYLKRFCLKADEILYVGDEHRDIEACKKTAVKIIAVVWGFDPLSLLESEHPSFIAHKPEDILRIAQSC